LIESQENEGKELIESQENKGKGEKHKWIQMILYKRSFLTWIICLHRSLYFVR
jgi:hypothetical protein